MTLRNYTPTKENVISALEYVLMVTQREGIKVYSITIDQFYFELLETQKVKIKVKLKNGIIEVKKGDNS